MSAETDPATHWDDAYADGDTTRSWFQHQPHSSLRLFDAAGVSPHDGVIDVGGGASTLVDALLARRFTDITVLDISAAGMHYAQRRLGPDAERVQWLATDVLSWRPLRTYQVWHDRAVFHFLTASQAQQQYLQTLHLATTPHSVAVFGCFAPDGPEQCSGLPVARYDAEGLASKLGQGWTLITHDRQEHTTPGGVVQPFTWAAFQRQT
ncbi:MAG: class I SAM-dependent methyltransferase [Mycobacteriaceae bacterium]